MPKNTKETQAKLCKGQAVNDNAPANEKLRALVRFLARRAAEKDYNAYLTQQEDAQSPNE